MKRLFRRCDHGSCALSPEDQATVDQRHALLAALRDPQPWTPGQSQDIAVQGGPFVERAHRARATTTAPTFSTWAGIGCSTSMCLSRGGSAGGARSCRCTGRA